MDELSVRLGVSPEQAGALADAVGGWKVGDRLIGADMRALLTRDALGTLAAFHAEQPLEPGAPLQWLRSRLRAPDDVSVAVLAALSDVGSVIVEQGVVRLTAFAPHLTPAQQGLSAALLAALDTASREPPTLDELAISLRADVPALTSIARLLAREGRVVAVESARYYSAATVGALLAQLSDGMVAGSDYGPAELRDLLGISRKYLIPFLEFTDRAGHTVRDPSGRRRRTGT